MSQTHLFSFEEICKDTEHIYNLLFTLNGAAAVSLVTLAISYDKNNILKGFEFLSGNILWFIISLFASLVFIMIPNVYKTFLWARNNRIYSDTFIHKAHKKIVFFKLIASLLLMGNFIYGTFCSYSALRYGINIL